MSVTGLLTTTAGQAAIIADLAATAELVITHVAWGDANGVPYDPNPAQVALVNERYRAGIASVAVVAGALVIEAVIPADTPDAQARPSHGFNVAEAAIFGTTGGVPVMLGLARMSNGYKPAPASGQAAIATFRFKLAVANPASIAVVIDPQAQIIVGRLVRPFWMTVDGHLNDPPVNPVQGATYVIGAAPTGAWAGFAGRLAQWVGVWSLASVPAGHVVADNSKGEADPLRYLKFIGGVWISAAATVDAHGMTRLASDAEALAAVIDTAALTPKQALKRSNVPVLEAAIVAASPTVPSGVTTTLTAWTILNSEMAAGSSFVSGVFTCGAGDAGLYAVLAFGELNINGYQEGIVVHNNTTTIGAGSGYGGGSGSTYGAFNCSGGVRLAAGDTLRMQASQSSGSNASPTGAGRFYLVRIKAA